MTIYSYIYDFIITIFKDMNTAFGSNSILNIDFISGVPLYAFISQVLTIYILCLILYLSLNLFKKVLTPLFKVGGKL